MRSVPAVPTVEHGPRRPLGGWGRYPIHECVVEEVTSVEAMADRLRLDASRQLIARGLGRSYGDSALLRSGVVLDQTRRDRFLGFDTETGVLSCEAGVSLASIIDVFLPRGWFLPTMPGTKHVTVGGAVAADVHGKNHHVDGTFGAWVRGLTLLLASGETLHCSPDREPEAFWATLGGMGLTGIILSADIQLVRTRTAYCRMSVRRTRDLADTLRVIRETDAQSRYSVAWVDCLSGGPELGRGVVMLADDAPMEALPPALRGDPLRPPRRSRLSVPRTVPFSLVGRVSVRAFNALYYAAHRSGEQIVHYDPFFCPLDRVGRWNLIYGPRGFIQYQALFPPETAAEGLRRMIEKVSAAGAASFLAVLKRTGPAGGGMLSFPRAGYTLALDIPHRRDGFDRLTRELDDIVTGHEGRVYLAKDAVSGPEAFAEMYPDLERFRAVKRRLDPDGRFASEQSRRLGITEKGPRHP